MLALIYISQVSDNSFWSLFAGMVALGLGCGLAFVAGNAALSFANDSERAFGLLTTAYMVFVFVMMSTNPVLRQMYPIVLPYAAMVAVQLLCLVLIWWKLPDTRLLSKGDDTQSAPSASGQLKLLSPLPLMLGLAVALSQLSLAGLWTFAEELGTGSGLSAQATASFLGFSQLTGLLGTPWRRGCWGASSAAVCSAPRACCCARWA
ncbi:hypothetical protein [Mycolicibacterium sp.]|uniref:hypothetical protein n=1 Tax=Mycolicibacterium sp. TaxID=2320850 RepID=UPI0028AFA8D7|nr:hypothetical protein [Mycolicibacterium sp.]